MPEDGSKPPAQNTAGVKPTDTAASKPPQAPQPAGSTPAATPGGTPSRPTASAAPSRTTPPATPPAPAAPVPDGKLVLGKGVSLAGHIRDAAGVLIEGDFTQATIEAGELVIGPSGRIMGQAVVASAEVHGQFEGELTVQDDLTVHETGSVSGTIRYGEFQAARGARLEGDIRTIGSEAPAATAAIEEPQPQASQNQDSPATPDAEPEKRSLGGMLRRK